MSYKSYKEPYHLCYYLTSGSWKSWHTAISSLSPLISDN
ncbi:MAG: hypothetical protein E6J11_21345, partial [Chloroflexi bacterium]